MTGSYLWLLLARLVAVIRNTGRWSSMATAADSGGTFLKASQQVNL